MTQEPSLDPAKLRFRPLCHGDLPLLHRWLNEPHASPWFHGGPPLADVVAEYSAYIDGREPIAAFLVSYGEQPIGMMNWQRAGDFPDFMALYQIDDANAANCDVVLGEPAFVHRGLGPAMIRRFAREIIFADPRITTLIIDPEQGNAIAIRAYEKAGFRLLRFIDDDGEGKPLRLMELSRSDLSAGVQRRACLPYEGHGGPGDTALHISGVADAAGIDVMWHTAFPLESVFSSARFWARTNLPGPAELRVTCGGAEQAYWPDVLAGKPWNADVFMLGQDWQGGVVDFAELGFGPSSLSPHAGPFGALHFLLPPNAAYDFWLDDVELVPQGLVGYGTSKVEPTVWRLSIDRCASAA